MNSKLRLFMIPTLIFSVNTWAQDPNPTASVPVIVGAGGGRAYINPGNYDQTEANVTDSAIEAMKLAGVTQKEDVEYVKTKVAELHTAYVEYSNYLLNGPLLEMETTGIQGNSVDVLEFMKVVGELRSRKAAFDSLLLSVRSINKNVLPSNYNAVITANGTQQQIPSQGMINLDPVVREYSALRDNELEPQLNSYANIKVDVYGVVLFFNQYKSLINPVFPGVASLNPEKTAQLNLQIANLRQRSRDVTFENRQRFADAQRNEYNTFGTQYGFDYRYVNRSGDEEDNGWFGGIIDLFTGSGDKTVETGRGNTASVPGVEVENDIEQRNAAFKRLIDSMWMGSYLRLTTGIQVCALQPKFVEASNFGAFKELELLRELQTQPACTKAELEAALEYTRRIIKYTGAQAEGTFSEGFFEAGILNRLGSLTTYALGQRPAAEAMHMLIQLVYAGIQEELYMVTPGKGLQAVRDMYTARYQSSPEQRAYYSKLKCSIDKGASGCKANEEDPFAEIGGVGQDGDLLQAFYDLQNSNKLARDFLDQAERIQSTLNAAREGSTGHTNINRRANGL